MHLNITLTPAAIAYLQGALQKKHGAAFRLSIKKTGCSGYSYFPEVVAAVNEEDIALDVNGIPFVIAHEWQHLLTDVHIDYVEEIKSGLKQKRLVFTNPKETSRCGCGESFHVE